MTTPPNDTGWLTATDRLRTRIEDEDGRQHGRDIAVLIAHVHVVEAERERLRRALARIEMECDHIADGGETICAPCYAHVTLLGREA